MVAGFAGLALILGVVADATDLVALLPEPGPARRLNGDLNIAVSGFRGLGSVKAAVQSAELSASLAEELSVRGAAVEGPLAPVVEVAGPESVGDLSMENRSAQAELEELNAAIGISGSLRSEPQATVLSVVIRINERQLHLAQPIGPLLGQRIRVAGAIGESGTARIQVRRRLMSTVDEITGLLLGLGELESGSPRRARDLLTRALRGWSTGSGREGLHLLIGHTLARERRYRRARNEYIRALDIHPGYLRAHFALAALDFHTNTMECGRRDTDERALRSVRTRFAEIARTASSTLRVKSQFALARTDTCLSQAGLARRFESAKHSFGSVVDAHQSGVPDVRQEAAESLGWLALIALPERGREPGPEVSVELARAAGLYRQAEALAIDGDRRRFFRSQARRLAHRLQAMADEALR